MNRLQDFQKQYGLKPDGIIGPKTLTVMQRVFGFSSKERLAHFIGQVVHETANFKYEVENLNYSEKGLLATFGKYFTEDTAKEPHKKLVSDYARKPKKIANLVYANRMGNGNEASGDGWKHRGQGPLMLTGKNNQEIFANKIRDLRILKNPGIIVTDYYFESALFFFTENRLWQLCNVVDNKSIIALSKKINGGVNGLKDRIYLTRKFYKMLKDEI